MLRFHDIDQNTDEWLDLRIGRLTGSSMSKVMANYGKAFGDPAKQLAVKIALERITGKHSINESFSNSHTDRGHKQEPIARALYEADYFVTVLNGGFFECEDLGCSPDGLVAEYGLVEIKSVIAHVHYANIARNSVDPAYKWQHYFNLQKTEREWIDFASYCADFPEESRLFTHRLYAEDCAKEFNMIDRRVCEFLELVDDVQERIIRGTDPVARDT